MRNSIRCFRNFAGILVLALLSGTASLRADAPAFVVSGALTETTNKPATIGMVFVANSNVLVTALGIYADPKLVSSEPVGLYDASGDLLASVTVPLTAPVTNGYYFVPITAVPLMAGNQYTVAAYYGANSWAYGNQPVTDPRLTYRQDLYVYASSLTFPTTTTNVSAYYGPNLLIAPPSGTNNIQVPGYSISLAANLNYSGAAGIAIDSANNVFMTNANMVYKQTPAGKQSVVAGGGPYSTFLGDGGPATSATLSSPLGVAVDSAGNLYIADTGNNRIRKVAASGTISTFAGPGSPGGPAGDGGPATSATLNDPTGIALDSAGNIYIADYRNYRVRKVTPAGIITTVAGTGTGPVSSGGLSSLLASLGDGGPATSATLLGPNAVAIDGSGNLYISDSGIIREVSAATGVITTVAGKGILVENGAAITTPHGDGGVASSAGFYGTFGIAVDTSGNIYVADTGGRLRAITAGGIINSIAGGGTLYPPSVGAAPAMDVAIVPSGIAVGSGGTLYMSDSSYANAGVWALTPTATPAFPLPSAAAANSASGFPVAPGSISTFFAVGGWVEIYGSYLGFDTRSWGSSDFSGSNAPTSLDGTSVSIGGQAAFISYISPSQINAQVPSTVGTGAQPLIVTTANGQSQTYAVTVRAEVPGLLTTPSFLIKGTQYAVALFSDGVTYVLPTGSIPGLPSRPAKAGDTITLYGTGFGLTTPYIPAGQITPTGNVLTLPLTVTVGSNKATIAYAGLAPGVVGLFQFNVVVPTIPSGTSIAQITFNEGAAGSATFYLAVQ